MKQNFLKLLVDTFQLRSNITDSKITIHKNNLPNFLMWILILLEIGSQIKPYLRGLIYSIQVNFSASVSILFGMLKINIKITNFLAVQPNYKWYNLFVSFQKIRRSIQL